MVLRLLTALSILTAAALSTASTSMAQAPRAEQPRDEAADPQALLAQCREALSKVNALSYKGVASSEGDKVPGYTATTTMARAEAGGWKLHVIGSGEAAEGKEAPAFEIGYDGVIARSVREKDKVVVEKAVTDMAELALFFSSQSAKHPVAWELLDDEPFANSANATYEGKGVVASVPCEIVMIPSGPAPGAKEGGAVVPAKTGVRVFLATEDHLPRRIDRIRAAAEGAAPAEEAGAGGGNAAASSRILTLTEIKTNDHVVSAPFSISVPDGYRVSTPQTKPLARAGQDGKRPTPPGGDPEDKAVLAVGSVAPDFALKDGDGKEHRLADYRGKVVFLDFWATWCPPCVASMPSVQRLHEEFKDQPVVVFGINMNDREDPVAYMRKKKFDYGLLLNGEKIADKYRINSIPAFFIIGPDGKILWSGSGYPQTRREAAARDAKVSAVIQGALAGDQK